MKILFLLLTLLPLKALAIVDMKNANYADTWIDLIAPGTGYDLRVRRTYNSRSLFNGMHGFGWCSDFETKLDITAEGNIKLTECGGGLEVDFTPRNFSNREINKTINQVISAHKKATPGISDKNLLKFKIHLKEDGNARSYYAKFYGIKVPVKVGTKFYANGREIEHIHLSKNEYIRYLSDNTIQKFNVKGQLTYVSDKNNNHLKLKYNKSGLLKTVRDNNGRQLTFSYYPSINKVKSISGPDGLVSTYKYKGDDVAEVTNAWKHHYQFKYDDLHNLTQISFPDKTTKLISYNQDKDWVTSYTDRDLCVETYDYKSKTDDPKNHYVSSVKKKCGKETVVTASYEFWHKVRKDGLKYLSRVKTIYGSQVTDITYHPMFGRPTKIRKNGVQTDFQYYKNGLVRSKEIRSRKGTEKVFYEYKNKFKKISAVTLAKFDLKGKQKKKFSTAFKYNSRANLTHAKTSSGQTLLLSYDRNGRISKIKDQSKKTVKIKYESRFGKPSFVERPGVGSISVSYKPNGEIKEVKSKEGPAVAVQVANIFNNLLEVISPATEELSL